MNNFLDISSVCITGWVVFAMAVILVLGHVRNIWPSILLGYCGGIAFSVLLAWDIHVLIS